MTPPKRKAPIQPRHHGTKEERESAKFRKERSCLGCGKVFISTSRFIFTCGCVK